MHSNRK